MTRVSSAQLDRITGLLLEWYGRNARDLPWRQTRDPYAIWVSEVMLQQTQVKTVISYWERWMKALPSVRSVANARPEKILKLWEGLGYYRRARHLQQAAQMVMAQFHGQFPRTFDEILGLPGVGRYTAGAICSIAFNQPTPILDGNVIRVLSRLFAIREPVHESKTQKSLWAVAEKLVVRAQQMGLGLDVTSACSHFNQSLMELGATICLPTNPDCVACPARKDCAARRRNLVEELPVLPPKTTTTSRHFLAVVLEKQGKLLIRKRPLEAVNGGLWEFPNYEIAKGQAKMSQAWLDQWGIPRRQWSRLPALKHAITRYRITVDVYMGRTNHPLPLPREDGQWLSVKRIQSLPFTSAHGKILKQYMNSRARGAFMS